MLRDSEDAYGHLMYNCLKGREVPEIVEREDGLFDVSTSLPRYYFADYSKWNAREKLALRYVRGRVVVPLFFWGVCWCPPKIEPCITSVR